MTCSISSSALLFLCQTPDDHALELSRCTESVCTRAAPPVKRITLLSSHPMLDQSRASTVRPLQDAASAWDSSQTRARGMIVRSSHK